MHILIIMPLTHKLYISFFKKMFLVILNTLVFSKYNIIHFCDTNYKKLLRDVNFKNI